MAPQRSGGEDVHTIGLPYHWGGGGLSTGDTVNDLLQPDQPGQRVPAPPCNEQAPFTFQGERLQYPHVQRER